jgi:NADH-quinone oxidoreductase subunit C
MNELDQAIKSLQSELGGAILAVKEFRGETTIELKREAIVPACQHLHDHPDLPFDFLAALTAVDYWPEEPRFRVVYKLYCLSKNVFLGLKVPLSGDNPTISTIESVYPNANWHEREVFDMFGIEFEGHSDLRRILMPHDWEGHPLRKDYPLGHEEVQFSFNFDEIDRRKRYAQE